MSSRAPGPDAAPRSRRRAAVPWIVCLVYAVLGVAWAVTNPAFASPDEGQHYVRALGLSQGTWIGPAAVDPNPSLTPKQRLWTNQATKRVPVPEGLLPAGFAPCMSGNPAASAACTDAETAPPGRSGITSVGTYQPLPYLLPALAARGADEPEAADLRMRLATVAVWLALIGAAIRMLWDAESGVVSLLGLLVAVTPQAVFVGASLTGSSLEIAAGCAFFAALLRLRRDAGAGTAPWVVAGVSGALLASSRSPGPVWVLLGLAVWALWTGRAGLRELWATRRAPALAALVAVAAAIVVNRFFESRYGPTVQTSLLPPLESVKAGRRALFDVFGQFVGDFGYLDTALPGAAVAAWAAACAVLVAASAIWGSARDRGVVLLTLALVAIGPIYLFAAVTRFTGFGLQGRHVLPLVVLLPLLTGEVVRSRAAAIPRVRLARVAVAVTAVCAAVQGVAWWTNARRYAVGEDGPWFFGAQDEWAPAGGWWPWALLVGAATLALLAVAATALGTGGRALSGPPGHGSAGPRGAP